MVSRNHDPLQDDPNFLVFSYGRFVPGRRGGRRSAGPLHQNGFPRTPTTPSAPPAPTTTYSAEISHREVRHEKYELPNRSNNSYQTIPSPSSAYRTQLGQSSMI